jgi:uncharacterized protein YecE (DUF72 family)
MDLQLGLFPDEPASESIRDGRIVGPAEASADVISVAASLPGTLRMGTSSWSFPGWDGIVYDRPASQAGLARHGLKAYGAHPLFRTVGIDRTYYRPISSEDFRTYADEVPRDFRFLVKANRLVTSPHDPHAHGVRTRNDLFLDASFAVDQVVGPAAEGLAQKAGPFLFQFSPIPPNLVGGPGAFMDRLHRFLEDLPVGPLYAVELRTPTFLTQRYAELLEATGAAHCYNVHPAMTSLDGQMAVVSPFYQPALVVRWMLHGGTHYEGAKDRYAPFDRIVDEDVPSRERIAVAVLDALVAERPAFVIANNKAEGSAPLSIVRLAERIAHWTPQVVDGRPSGSSRNGSP